MAVDRDRLHRLLTPRTVAVVGAKGPDYSWLENNREFQGPLYSVQLDPNEIIEIEKRGFQNFLKLEDIPDEIDLVICAVPRPIVPYIVADTVKKGAAGMAIFSAGFAETGEEDAAQLQEQIVKIANDAGMPIVGPNCMGVYNRRRGVKFTADVEQGEGGNVSILGQSGTHTIGATTMAQRAGIKVGRGISFGNAVVVNEADYLEYLRDDDDTEVIGMYLEGVKDGRRFYEALLINRNLHMAARAAKKMKEAAATKFVFAFGTFHFVGERSVVELLRKDGFTVTRMAAPSAEQEEAILASDPWLEQNQAAAELELEPVGAGG